MGGQLGVLFMSLSLSDTRVHGRGDSHVLKVKQRVSASFLVACSFIHSIHRTQIVITVAKENTPDGGDDDDDDDDDDDTERKQRFK